MDLIYAWQSKPNILELMSTKEYLVWHTIVAFPSKNRIKSFSSLLIKNLRTKAIFITEFSAPKEGDLQEHCIPSSSTRFLLVKYTSTCSQEWSKLCLVII